MNSSNAFSVLNPIKEKKKIEKKQPEPVLPTFNSNQASVNWGDEDSDQEIAAFVVDEEKKEEEVEYEEVEGSDSESEGDESEGEELEEENKDDVEVTTAPKPVVIQRTMSKKEKKQKEMDDLEKALAEMGVEIDESATDVKEEAPIEEQVAISNASSSKNKKKKKKGKKQAVKEEVGDKIEVVNIKDVVKLKGKKKMVQPKAVQIAKAEAEKKKKKSKKDKATFNEFY